MLTMRINIRKELIKDTEVTALIKKVVALDPPNQIENLKFIPEPAWAACKGLENIPIFGNLISAMESEVLQWKKWFGDEKPESCELPKSFREISLFHRILLLRALRPDRLQSALVQYVTESLGNEYIEQPAFDPFVVYNEMGIKTPAFFVLYPGVDPTPDVERIGQKYNKKLSDGTFKNISMGQGQEKLAISYLQAAAKDGNWVMIQNVHLMTDWMKEFEQKLEVCQDEDPHPDFRVFISSEPPPMDHMEIIPESILQNAIKVSNEAPTNLKANMRRAISKFDEAYYDRAKSHKYPEFKALIFGLCMFHSLILGRRKFGSIGWSKIYNFNDGDLTICGDILHNYLSKFDKVPYEDLKYLFGEIMYGGHITDDWDRRTNNTYLQVLIRPEIMIQMQLTLYPGFKSPDPEKFERGNYVQYVEEKLPIEVPAMFGLHPNAEIGYLTNLGESIFSIISRIAGGGVAGGGASDALKNQIEGLQNTLPENFNILEITGRYTELTPYLIVSLQEIERMNNLLGTIRFSLHELN
jgi:dynein heavy chain, axonemal